MTHPSDNAVLASAFRELARMWKEVADRLNPHSSAEYAVTLYRERLSKRAAEIEREGEERQDASHVPPLRGLCDHAWVGSLCIKCGLHISVFQKSLSPSPSQAEPGAVGIDTQTWPSELHPDSMALVLSFAHVLADKLRAAEVKYGYSNHWLMDDWEDKCRADLLGHLWKGDPRDVAIYAAFMWKRGWSTRFPEADDKFLREVSCGLSSFDHDTGTAAAQEILSLRALQSALTTAREERDKAQRWIRGYEMAQDAMPKGDATLAKKLGAQVGDHIWRVIFDAAEKSLALEAERDALRDEIDKVKQVEFPARIEKVTDKFIALLREAGEKIHALSEQQAMPDDFYQETLTKIDRIVSGRWSEPHPTRPAEAQHPSATAWRENEHRLLNATDNKELVAHVDHMAGELDRLQLALNTMQGEKLRHCECVFEKGTCVELCKYHNDQLKTLEADNEALRREVEEQERSTCLWEKKYDDAQAHLDKAAGLLTSTKQLVSPAYFPTLVKEIDALRAEIKKP